MSGNSSSTSSDLLLYRCFGSYMAVLVIKSILILPLSSCILYLALQKWRQQRSFKALSHSDIFTYHLAVNEFFSALCTFCYLFGINRNNVLSILGFSGSFVTFYCQVFFHLFTCVERYLAVVHPVTYLSLRNTRGVRIRNISSGCVWLLSFGLGCCYIDETRKSVSIAMLCVLLVFLVVVTFCSLSVLCALIRPGPGEGGRERVDQSKQRAFHTITAICVVLWVCFVGFLVSNVLELSYLLDYTGFCLMNTCVNWISLPSGLVSPLLFFHKEGKLPSKRFHFKSKQSDK